MANVQITFPDGALKEFPGGTTALEVARSVGTRLASDALVAKLDGRLIDLASPIESSGPINFITPSLEFWWNFAPRWVVRGTTGINIDTGRHSATSTYFC